MDVLKSLLSIFHSSLWEGVFDRINNGHGIFVTIIGLLAVFAGLVILWAVTANLPNLINLFEKKPGPRRISSALGEDELEAEEEKTYREIAAAIGVALAYELEEEEISVITLRNIEQEMSPWVVASRPATMRQP